jgi:putative ABC transport system ATP-binding protein
VPEHFAVHARGITKSFLAANVEINALREVDFYTHAGELLMIVGPSGCGKTTLLSIIAGTLHFDRGEIDILGRPLHAMSPKQITELRKKSIGFIFQQYHLIRTLNCLENVMIPLLLNHVKKEEAETTASAILSQVGLSGRELDHPKNLSGGQQQRVAIARALVHGPELIICDEPTAALDAETGASILELLQHLAKSLGKTVIIVTHDNRILKYADRVVKMDDGGFIE